MTRAALLAVVLMSLAPGAAAQSMIRPPDATDPIDVVLHVDVLPDHAASARDAVSAYVDASRREPGAVHIDAMQEVFRNHFDLVEIWRDEAAYRAHQSSAATLRFRDAVAPWLGSPFDERVGTPVLR